MRLFHTQECTRAAGRSSSVALQYGRIPRRVLSRHHWSLYDVPYVSANAMEGGVCLPRPGQMARNTLAPELRADP